MMKKIILGLVIVLGLNFCAVSSVSAITYSEIETLPEIISEVTSEGNLSYGMRSEVIRELQQILSRDSSIYPEKLTTGYFGLLTQQAVKRFQEKKGFLQTGIVNKHLKGLIWDWEAPEPDESMIAKISCDEVCKSRTNWLERRKYDYGTCRMSCHTGEVSLGYTLDCNPSCPPGVACATVEYYCCCGNKDGGDSGKCTDSDGGINKYVKGKTCQPSRWGGIIDQDNPVSGITSSITKLFCKTDYCMTVKTPGGGTYLQEHYCENGKMMSKSIKCENGCKNGACVKGGPEPVCTPEGIRQHIGDPVCCDGLIQIGNDFVDPYGECNGIDDGSHYCAKCGNGICGPGENRCNCPEDCEDVCHKELNKEDCESFGGTYESYQCPIGYPCDPEWYCKCPCLTDSDCTADMCQQGRCANDTDAYCCYEYTYECVNGKCEYERKEYKNYTRVGGKCSDTCGDGVCKFPEAQWWCPEDCKGCVGDGEVKSVLGECCEGLHVIASGYRNNINYCTSEVCGNKACQALENKYNCPRDCKTVNVQPVINMIRQAIEKLNSAIRLLGDLIAIPSVELDSGSSSASGSGGGGSSSGE